MLRFLAVVVTSLLMTSSRCANFRCSEEEKVNRWYGDGTFYEHVRGELPPREKIPSPCVGCRPIHIYHVLRHGAQHPEKLRHETVQLLRRMKRKVNETGNASHCAKDLREMQEWEIDIEEGIDRNLTGHGMDEIQDIMIRFYMGFPEIYPDGAEAHRYKFVSSNYASTITSMEMAAQYILSSGKHPQVRYMDEPGYLRVIPRHRDRFVRFDKTCERFGESTRNSDADYERFMKGKRMRRLVSDVRTRLGAAELNYADVYGIYLHGCKFQYQAHKRVAPWCKIFSRRQMKSLQFASSLRLAGELRHNNVSRDMSCNLARSVVTSIRDAHAETSSGRRFPLATLVFGHKYTVHSLAANFGFYQDKGESERLRWRDRNAFRVDQMLPTAANIAFVLYKCENDDYRVQVWWNEKIVDVPGCSGQHMCPLTTFIANYPRFITGTRDQCRFRDLCRSTTPEDEAVVIN